MSVAQEFLHGDDEPDDDLASEAHDSDYGLSDSQLEELWQKFSDRHDLGIEAICVSDEFDDSEAFDTDFGISEEQIAEAMRRFCDVNDPLRAALGERASQGASPNAPPAAVVEIALDSAAETSQVNDVSSPVNDGAVLDPLRHFLKQRQSVSEASGKCLAPSGKKADRFVDEQAPCRSQVRPSLRVVIVSSRKVHYTTFYLFRVFDQGEERFYMKRFSDFVRLDDALHVALNRGDQRRLPALPEWGLLGLCTQLGFGAFNERRQLGLQRYVDELVSIARTGSVAIDSLFDDFFGHRGQGRVFTTV